MTYHVTILISFVVSHLETHWRLEKSTFKQEFYILNGSFVLLLDGKATGNSF